MNSCFLTLTVLTYNSEKFIANTLESISFQADKDIQVIVSDDCSTDNTISIVEEWKQRNQSSFFEIIFIKSKINTGIVENKKRTFEHIKGEWTKGIAGDDLLHSDAIKNIRIDIDRNKNNKVIIGKAQIIAEDLIQPILIPKSEITKKLITPDKVKNFIFEGYTIPAITLLIKSEVLTNNEYYKFAPRNFEDVPFHLALLTDGIHFNFSNSIYILYRKHAENLSSKKSDEILSKAYIDYQKILIRYSIKNFKIVYTLNSLWNLAFGFFIIKTGNKGEINCLINTFRKKLQPKRLKNLVSKPF